MPKRSSKHTGKPKAEPSRFPWPTAVVAVAAGAAVALLLALPLWEPATSPATSSAPIGKRTVLTPSYVRGVLATAERQGWPLGGAVAPPPADRAALRERARAQVQSGALREASASYGELLAGDPWDADVLGELHTLYDRKYDGADRFALRGNFSASFLGRAERHAAAGGFELEGGRRVRVARVSERLPLFVVDGLLSDAECAQMRELHEGRVRRFSQPPLVCFQNDAFINNPQLQRHFLRPDPREDAASARQTRFCLSQRASRAVGAAAAWSFSTSVFNGEHGITDLLARRLEEHFGLTQSHARDWQLLSYEKSVAYNDHTDCTEGSSETLEGMCKSGFADRAATVLAYLADDVQGGHTEFPKLGVRVQPKKGRVALFWGFGPEQTCDSASTHRSNAVTGDAVKVVAQRWYSYCEDRFQGDERPPQVGRGIPGQGRLPHQPMVSCDYTTSAEDVTGGVPDWRSTCRWYEADPYG